jgi:hypothetical protein
MRSLGRNSLIAGLSVTAGLVLLPAVAEAAPDTTITDGPMGLTGISTPTFSFRSTDASATFECRFDGAPFTPCSSPWTTDPLSDGSHTFAVRAIDSGANPDPTPATRSFTVDTTSPDTAVAAKRQITTRKKRALVSFSLFSEPGAGFQCSIDFLAFFPCGSPLVLKLPLGKHTLTVRARDALGNLDAIPATLTVRVKAKRVKTKK